MQMRFVVLPRPPGIPYGYVHVAFYGGTSNFPMGSFYVLSVWWDLFRADPEIVIEPLEEPGTMTVETWPAIPHEFKPQDGPGCEECGIDWELHPGTPKGLSEK